MIEYPPPGTLIHVDMVALGQLLRALNGPPHLVNELQITRSFTPTNPINVLIEQYNDYAHSINELLK